VTINYIRRLRLIMLIMPSVLLLYFFYIALTNRYQPEFHEIEHSFLLAVSETYSSPPICLPPLRLTVSRNTEAEILQFNGT